MSTLYIDSFYVDRCACCDINETYSEAFCLSKINLLFVGSDISVDVGCHNLLALVDGMIDLGCHNL